MRKNFGAQSWLFPMPVLIVATYDENGVPNAMNAAWGGIHDTNMLGVCIDPGHKTAANWQQRKAFTVSIGDAAHLVQCDYLGIVSGNDEPQKVAKAGLTAVKADFVDAPLLREFPVTLECRLVSYDNSCGCAVGEIVNVSADGNVLGDDGKISLEKFVPLCYDPVHHKYVRMGEVAGSAFSDGLKLK
ncbi:MAG: flavin reductase family protein [Lentisphaeria bacterium]|nr:flavin reductase family protein [Lentisphaeria bacterium]